MRLYFSICFFAFCSFCLYGQKEVAVLPDTLFLINGKQLAVHVIDTSGEQITIEKLHSRKHKRKEIDRNNIFSVRYGSSGKEVVFYIYDTLTGNDFTVQQARMLIAGEHDAQKGFHATATTLGAFVIGVASGISGISFFAFGPPFLYAGIMSYPRIHVRHKSVTHLADVKYDNYLYGYDNVARRKRVLKALLWGGIGLVAGVAVHFVYYNK